MSTPPLLAFKVHFDCGIIRRFSIPSGPDAYDTLVRELNAPWRLFYVDPEGDRVLLTGPSDFTECLRISKEPIRIEVQKKKKTKKEAKEVKHSKEKTTRRSPIAKPPRSAAAPQRAEASTASTVSSISTAVHCKAGCNLKPFTSPAAPRYECDLCDATMTPGPSCGVVRPMTSMCVRNVLHSRRGWRRLTLLGRPIRPWPSG